MTVKIEDMFGNAAYEFVDLIKAEPLVSESSPFMDVDKKKFREVQRSEKITQRAKDASDEATAEVAKRKMSAKAKVQLPNIRKEERLVDKILAELEEATLHLGENRFASHGGRDTDAGSADLTKEEIETIDERVRLEADNGNLLMVVAAWKGKSYQLTMFFPQPSMPTREEVESEIQKVYPGSRLMSYRITRRGEGQPIMQVVNSHSKNYLLNNGNIGEDWQKVNKGDKTDGMSKKAVAAYRRENPGSKLKTAVTGKVKKGSKDAKRRKSFCARSKGQQDMHNIDCSKTPDKPVCKARRRWKC